MCRNLSPQDAYNMIQTDKDIEILDVRTPMEYHNDGRIPGAKLIPISEIQFRLKELNPAKNILFTAALEAAQARYAASFPALDSRTSTTRWAAWSSGASTACPWREAGLSRGPRGSFTSEPPLIF